MYNPILPIPLFAAVGGLQRKPYKLRIFSVSFFYRIYKSESGSFFHQYSSHKNLLKALQRLKRLNGISVKVFNGHFLKSVRNAYPKTVIRRFGFT